MKSVKVDFFPSYFVGLSGRLGWALKCGLVPVGGVLVPCEESRRPAADEPSVSRGSSRSSSSSSSSSSCSAGIDFVHLHRLLLRGAAHKALPSGLRQQQQHATEQFLSSDNTAVLSSVSGEVSGDSGTLDLARTSAACWRGRHAGRQPTIGWPCLQRSNFNGLTPAAIRVELQLNVHRQ